jgi:hypothetical protein
LASEQMKVFIICLTHGIDVINLNMGTNPTGWNFSMNGSANFNYTEMQRRTREDNHVQSNAEKAFDIAKAFSASLEHFNDIRYIVHRMQKPAFEMPNPVIMSTFLRDKSQPASVSAEGTTAHDKENRHSFYHSFVNYFREEDGSDFQTEARTMQQLIRFMFAMYDTPGSNLWTISNVVPASTYMHNNATELPSCAYHGNLLIDKLKGVREEVRCVGHLGNSFPGCSTIRQGKGMLNMYERAPLPIHVM